VCDCALLAAIYPRLQGILITATGIAMFILAMLLIPRFKSEKVLPEGPQLSTA
jgi:hypothetical protein